MSNPTRQPCSHFSRQREKLCAMCRWAARALEITEGEFWVWYGSPFMLQRDSRR